MGMLAVIAGVFFIQLFLNGLNLFLTGGLLGLFGAGGVAAYFTIEHVRSRVDRFLHPGVGDNWQVDKAQQAFGAGGLFGRGPGEGHVKDLIPDAHADFVFAVAGEEFGMIICLLIIGVFAFVVLRALLRALNERDMYVVLATAGLAAGFGLQAFDNMASTLRLIPTKGMTLPFISYGGSSAIAVAVGIGMLLALTRRRHGEGS
jgi:cell division protein FtsW